MLQKLRSSHTHPAALGSLKNLYLKKKKKNPRHTHTHLVLVLFPPKLSYSHATFVCAIIALSEAGHRVTQKARGDSCSGDPH